MGLFLCCNFLCLLLLVACFNFSSLRQNSSEGSGFYSMCTSVAQMNRSVCGIPLVWGLWIHLTGIQKSRRYFFWALLLAAHPPSSYQSRAEHRAYVDFFLDSLPKWMPIQWTDSRINWKSRLLHIAIPSLPSQHIGKIVLDMGKASLPIHEGSPANVVKMNRVIKSTNKYKT